MGVTRASVAFTAAFLTMVAITGVGAIKDAIDEGLPGQAILGTMLFLSGCVGLIYLAFGPIGGGS